METKNEPWTVDDLKEGILYKVDVLQRILKNLNLLHSIFTIRDYETWKCLDYKCAKRHDYKVEKCERCGGPVREPLIPSPRTTGGGKGFGHRRYTKDEIIKVVDIFRNTIK